MFLVGSLVKITDISNCQKVELNEVFEVLSSNKTTTTIKNKDGEKLGAYCTWRFVSVVDPVANATKPPEDEWFYFDNVKHAGHILRKNIDEVGYKGDCWITINESAGKVIKSDEKYYHYRCKKCQAPEEIATTVAEDDWVIIDKSIYGHLTARIGDECNYKNTKWLPVKNVVLSYNYYEGHEFRCKRSDLPAADATKPQMTESVKPATVETQKFIQFWVGQNAICNEKGLSLLTYNKTYTILEVNTLSSGFYVKVKDDRGDINQFLSSRFRAADAPVADAAKPQVADPAITNLCVEVAQQPIATKDKKMFSNKFQEGQTVICEEYDSEKRKLTVGKKYIVINNDRTNDGSHIDMISVINDLGEKEPFFVHRFSAATAEKVAAAKRPKRIVAKVTNNYLTRGQSYEVVGYYIPAAESYKVKINDKTGYSLSFRSDCFESDISLSDVTNVDGATSTKEDEMKKETAVKVASVVGKFATGWGFRALNYWVFEPAAGIGRPIMKSVRYATFLGGLAAVGYGYYHPQEVKDALVSCLPTVSIEAPAILSGK